MAEVYEEVKSPKHYQLMPGVEVIHVIEALGMGIPFCWSNVIKYLLRAGKKPGTPSLKDMKKAQFYLNRLVELLEEGDGQDEPINLG